MLIDAEYGEVCQPSLEARTSHDDLRFSNTGLRKHRRGAGSRDLPPGFHADLRQNVGAELFDRFYSESADRQIDDLRRVCETAGDERVLVAEWDGVVVGFVSLSMDQNESVG